MNRFSLGVYHRRLHKLRYYAGHVHLGVLPFKLIAKSFENAQSEFHRLPESEQHLIVKRVDYYNQLSEKVQLVEPYTRIYQFKKRGFSAYFYDIADWLRYFPLTTPFAYEFGDVTHVPTQPTFVKSRPVVEYNQNSVLLKLDSVRHFYICKDPYSFEDKKDLLMWRGAAHQLHRKVFLEKYYDNPICDVACVHADSIDQPYHGSFLSVQQQLRYKYILSIEGNDVATNLKWILASNSLCLMIQPKFETWLMEGLLQPNIHYVQLQDDYTDLNEKISYYQRNPQSAQKIIHNAHQWMAPFLNQKMELITHLMVLKKYFDFTYV